MTETTVEETTSTTVATTTIEVEAEPTNTPLKSIEEVAREVWAGQWGNGPERQKRLEEAGYNYDEVQEKVQELKGECYSAPELNTDELTLIKSGCRGTYYGPEYSNHTTLKGGSGRQLIDCSYGNDVKGSIASYFLYKKYGYNYNGRTTIYLKVKDYPEMDGWYYLDDCCASYLNTTIDFYYSYSSNVPFRKAGVISVDCYI